MTNLKGGAPTCQNRAFSCRSGTFSSQNPTRKNSIRNFGNSARTFSQASLPGSVRFCLLQPTYIQSRFLFFLHPFQTASPPHAITWPPISNRAIPPLLDKITPPSSGISSNSPQPLTTLITAVTIPVARPVFQSHEIPSTSSSPYSARLSNPAIFPTHNPPTPLFDRNWTNALKITA